MSDINNVNNVQDLEKRQIEDADILTWYVNSAKRTEKVVETVAVNKKFLLGIIGIIIASSNILNQIKRNVFYNSKFDDNIIRKSLFDIADIMNNSISDSDSHYADTEVVQINTRVFHALIGIQTESAELLENLDSMISSDSPVDLVNLGEEWGDCCWYGGGILTDAIGVEWSDILKTNMRKLAARFPDGTFTDNSANNRNLANERVILEGGIASNKTDHADHSNHKDKVDGVE